MTPLLGVEDLEGELRSIEKLIEDLLARKAAVHSCLANAVPGGVLQSSSSAAATAQPAPAAEPVPAAGRPPTPRPWATVAKKSLRRRKRTTSMPLFDASLDTSFPLSNFFAPLSGLQSTPSPSSSAARAAPRRNSATPASQQRLAGRKRPASPPLSTGSQSPSSSAPRSEKRPCLSVSQSELVNPIQLSPKSPPIPIPSANIVSASPSSQPTTQEPSIPAHLSPISSLPVITKNRSKLSIHKYDNIEADRAQVLLVGDSITRSIKLPGGFTYSLSGGKTADFIQLIPALIDVHPCVHTILIHSGCNDVMNRESSSLQADLSSLAVTVQSLGKRCVLSGPIPDMFNNSERFSRILGLHTWLQKYCSTSDVSFINNFDSFWCQGDLFKNDKLHPNVKGRGTLYRNFINFIAFSLD